MRRFTWSGVSMCTGEETARIIFLNHQLKGHWFCYMNTDDVKLELCFIQEDASTTSGTLYCRDKNDWQKHPPSMYKRHHY
jgi:hypothetical protein